MTVGLMFSGIIMGVLGVLWALSAGVPVVLALLLYPVAGSIGALGFLAVHLLQPDRVDDHAGSRQARSLH